MSDINIILTLVVIFFVYRYIKKYLASRNLKQYTTGEAKQVLNNNKGVVVLDVRTEGERNSGFIKGSLHIPVNQLSSRVHELEKFRNNEIIVYCRSGNRSLNAASYLSKKGFNAANLKGGFLAWN